MASKNKWGFTRQSQLDAVRRYNRENTVQFNLRLNLNTDKDIISWLKAQENKQGKVKELIRKEIMENESNDRKGRPSADGEGSRNR